MNSAANPPGAAPVARREIVVSLRGVTKTFDSFFSRALVEASFDVRRGEVFALLGPAGSGKSITLRILAGRLRPTEGTVRVFGRSPWRGASKRRIGYLPAKGGEGREDRGWLERVAGWFSRGGGAAERRPDLKQALLGGRDCVMLDEPFAGLDENARRELRTLIRSLAEQGRTVIFSANALRDAAGVCDRAAVYSEGKIRLIGALDELLTQPSVVGWLAPILQESVARELLEAIRKGLALPSERTLTQTAIASDAETATKSVAERTLASMVKPPPEPTKPTPEKESVDHKKLEELTRADRPPPDKLK